MLGQLAALSFVSDRPATAPLFFRVIEFASLTAQSGGIVWASVARFQYWMINSIAEPIKPRRTFDCYLWRF
ncbi:hypothetical protein, partial [Providencia rustigianii]|uniref:hypothetical protein n=1 Tax=Providencia rustigianii TaxID=158850 RepID=UPI0035E59CD5